MGAATGSYGAHANSLLSTDPARLLKKSVGYWPQLAGERIMVRKLADVAVDGFPTLVATEGTRMLCRPDPVALSQSDLEIYRAVVPADHFPRKVLDVIPWDDFFDELARPAQRGWSRTGCGSRTPRM